MTRLWIAAGCAVLVLSACSSTQPQVQPAPAGLDVKVSSDRACASFAKRVEQVMPGQVTLTSVQGGRPQAVTMDKARAVDVESFCDKMLAADGSAAVQAINVLSSDAMTVALEPGSSPGTHVIRG